MANTMSTQVFDPLDRLDDRPLVLLTESDGKETWFHGLAVGPAGMTYEAALAEVDAAYAAVRAADVDGACDYDDVHDELERRGMKVLSHGVWDEACADLSSNDVEEGE